MNIIAHRGFAEDYVENTESAFKKAKSDADFIELDVRSTSDNIPIVFHDSTLERMCGKKENISHLTKKEIQKQYIKDSNKKIPTLENILKNINAKFLIEIKDINIVDKTIQICEKYNSEIIYQSFNPNIIKNIPDSCTKMILCTPEKYLDKDGIPNNSVTNIQEGYNLAQKTNSDGLSLHYSLVDEIDEDTDYAHYVWTIRSPKTVNKLSTSKINGIITDSIKYV